MTSILRKSEAIIAVILSKTTKSRTISKNIKKTEWLLVIYNPIYDYHYSFPILAFCMALILPFMTEFPNMNSQYIPDNIANKSTKYWYFLPESIMFFISMPDKWYLNEIYGRPGVE